MNCVGAKKRSHSAIDRELLTMSRIQFDFLGLFSDGTLYLRLWTIDKKSYKYNSTKIENIKYSTMCYELSIPSYDKNNNDTAAFRSIVGSVSATLLFINK